MLQEEDGGAPAATCYRHPEAVPCSEPCSVANIEVGEGGTEGIKWEWSNSLPARELQPPVPLHPLHDIQALLCCSKIKPE